MCREFFCLCTKKAVLATLLQNYRQKADDILLNVWKWFENMELFHRKYPLEVIPMNTKNAIFTTLPKRFRQKHDNCRSDWKNVFRRSKSFLKITLWELRMLFRQFYWKIFAGRPKDFWTTSSKKGRKKLFEKKNSQNDRAGHVQSSFDHPAENFSTKKSINLESTSEK